MKRRLHPIAFVLFVLCLLYDIVVWGALPGLSDVGASAAASAHREAPLAATYIWLGRPIDAAVPLLRTYGAKRLAVAFSDPVPRVDTDAPVAMDVFFDRAWARLDGWIKTVYWAAPIFLLLFLILWARRPKPVRVFGTRR